MKRKSIRKYLKPYSIRQQRTTTIRHAFASSLASHDAFEDGAIRAALIELGQDPDDDLRCVYCGEAAICWDHLDAIVRDGRHSGSGHTVRNLVPACRGCNEKKGNRDWRTWVEANCDKDVKQLLDGYVKSMPAPTQPSHADDRRAALLRQHGEIPQKILDLLSETDKIADELRRLRNPPAKV